MSKGIKVLKYDINKKEIIGYYESLSQAAKDNWVKPKYIKLACETGKIVADGRWEYAKYKYSCKWGKWWISGDL